MNTEPSTTTATTAFEYWLQLQEHRWNARIIRRIAINNYTGLNLSIDPFPIDYSAEEGVLRRIDDDTTYTAQNTEEFMEFVERLIWERDPL